MSQRSWADAVGDQTDRPAAHAVVLAGGAAFPDALAGDRRPRTSWARCC